MVNAWAGADSQGFPAQYAVRALDEKQHKLDTMIKKKDIKRLLGELPLTAEVYWQLRQGGRPLSKSFSMRRTAKRLPDWVAQANRALQENSPAAGKGVLLFTTLRYWIEHATLMSVALAGQGHQVTLAYLPYANWHAPINRFDLRRNNAYARSILLPAERLLNTVSFIDNRAPDKALPSSIKAAIEQVSVRDVQYTQQIEEVDQNSELYLMRMKRNRQAAQTALRWMRQNRPDVLITPNGSILEMGAVYQVAGYLDIPIVTYEFGEQRDRIWIAQDAEVMRQDTDDLWRAYQNIPLSENQLEQIRALFASRQRADLWENFSRRWQGIPSQGGAKVRQELGLDDRPVALLAANVIGDSLTLGRQVFTDDMTEWLKRTIFEFAQRSDEQLVVRIHPGERYTQGPSVADVVESVLPALPDHIHLVPANAPMNTYDLVEIADLGLVYTTTVGMEMAMSGVPVIVVGRTHYRAKGFTLDPASWEVYENMSDSVLSAPEQHRLTREQVDLAWNYAYRFFFDYPSPFPWHLLNFWHELDTWSVKRVLSKEGQDVYGDTFRYLVGEPRHWSSAHQQQSIVEKTVAGSLT